MITMATIIVVLQQSISHAADLITQLVSNETSRVEDPRLLENVRRQAARRVMALQRGAEDTNSEGEEE